MRPTGCLRNGPQRAHPLRLTCRRAQLITPGLHVQEPHGLNLEHLHLTCGLPGGSAGKEFACIARNLGSIPVLGRSPGEGKGHPFQYSGLENSMGCMDHGATKSRTRLNDFHFQMPAGILTGAGGTTHPCHLFPPKTQALLPAYPVLCPPLPSSSRLYFLGTPGPCLCSPSRCLRHQAYLLPLPLQL